MAINKTSGRRFVPNTIEFPRDIRADFGDDFKLYKTKKGEDQDKTFSISSNGEELLRQAKSSNSLPDGMNVSMLQLLVYFFKANKNNTPVSVANFADDMNIDYSKADKLLDKLQAKNYITTSGESSEYRLYISPLMKASLEMLTRGRTSSDWINKTPGLVKRIQERIPGPIRGVLKKYSDKMNSGLQMYPINVKIKDVLPDQTIVFYNPGHPDNKDFAVDQTIGENINEDEFDAVYQKRLAVLKDKAENEPEHQNKFKVLYKKFKSLPPAKANILYNDVISKVL
jgi:DNA-binding MarR family transcriptional regulator